jgi:hypothetical protein
VIRALQYVASHGYADPHGIFYLMPYDTGGANLGISEDVLQRCQTTADRSAQCQRAKDLLRRSVSSGDLAAWWSGCHSGAVPGKEFRPGPLGDPGFGQLAYDKGMEILTASQPAQTELREWVTGGEGRTLLVDAFETVVRANPHARLEEWLRDTEQQLPLTVKNLYPQLKDDAAQRPVLLDFSPKRNESASAR